LFPVKEIINIIRKYQPSALIFVDGAHAVGQTPISISDISPDFYCTNYHKWGFAPKSVCLLWVNEKYLN
jgi:selenocysteine lyase/cysteine desulfurase